MEEKMMRASLKQRQDVAEALTPRGSIVDSIDEDTTETLSKQHVEDLHDGDLEHIEENPVANNELAELLRSCSAIHESERQPKETQPLGPKLGVVVEEPQALQVEEAEVSNANT